MIQVMYLLLCAVGLAFFYVYLVPFLLSNHPQIWFRWLRLKSRIIWAVKGDRYLFWHRMTSEIPNEFESYGVYDPHVLTVIVSLMCFKPLEYLLDGFFSGKA
jgi:hypothetical protein